MFALLQLLSNWLARFGLNRRETVAEGPVTDPAQAWVLCANPAWWSLWMPGVRDVVDPSRAPRAGARYACSLRKRSGRLGLAGSGGTAHVQVQEWEPGVRFAWRLLIDKGFEDYAITFGDGVISATARGGESALVVISELERQSRP